MADGKGETDPFGTTNKRTPAELSLCGFLEAVADGLSDVGGVWDGADDDSGAALLEVAQTCEEALRERGGVVPWAPIVEELGGGPVPALGQHDADDALLCVRGVDRLDQPVLDRDAEALRRSFDENYACVRGVVAESYSGRRQTDRIGGREG